MKPILLIRYPSFILLSLLLFSACSSGPIMDYPQLYRQQVIEWENSLISNPNDFEALKNLGMYYSQIKEHESARIHIDKAISIEPNDPALILYKGINLEFFGKTQEALTYYGRYEEVPEQSPYREMLEGRLLWIKRQQNYSDIRMMIGKEDEISASEISENTMAVFPLIYQGDNPDYVPLSRGFSEMISIDLAKVKSLTVLERIRIQAVLDELQFSQSEIVDQSTAPRTGKLLRAGTIVSGDYNITDDSQFRINLGSWDSQSTERKSWVNKSGGLSDFFALQKEIVFSFLESNGILLTQQEKESIAYIPTQNLESFLAYSRGLMLEDAGKFNEASMQYQRASEFDPQFQVANEKIKTTGMISKSSGSKEDIAEALRVEDPVVKNELIDISDSRAQNLTSNITSNFVQGIDSRSPAEESNISIILLPPPPPPPSGE